MQTFTGLEYIKIDVANSFGHGKLTWDQRIQWFDHNEPNLTGMDQDAEEPILYRKGLRAYHNALQGVPTGFMMGLDATASGIQIMAALMGCVTSAMNTNLGDTGKREDIYQKVTDMTNAGANVHRTRKEVKYPVMTTFYGSTQQPKDVFGEDDGDLDIFYGVLGSELPGPMECLSDIQSCWQPGALSHSWTLPDGHTAYVPVTQAVDKKIEVDELDHATFTHRAYIIEGADAGLSLAANVIHSIDGWMVREQIRRAAAQGFSLLHIHDSFWASPNFMNQVRQNYIDILVYIADSDILQDILRQVTGSSGILTKLSNNLSDLIKKSDYALS